MNHIFNNGIDMPYYSEEFMFEFTKWTNSKYKRLKKGWKSSRVEDGLYLFTTKELLEEFKNTRNVSE